MAETEPDVSVAPPENPDLDALPLEDLPTEPTSPRVDDGGADSVPQSGSRKCSICCGWWTFLFFAVFQFIFGVACLAVSSARVHDPGIAFGVLVIFILLIYLFIRRKDISLGKFRCRGNPDPHIDETVGRARSIPKTFAFCVFILVAFVFSLIAFILTAIAWESPDPASWSNFPNACPSTVHCSRVSFINGVNNNNIFPASYNTSTSALMDATKSWLNLEDDDNPNAFESHHVLHRNSTYLHARIVTGFWGFTDDFAVFAVCNNLTGESVLYAQSQSRVSTGGSGNPDHNPARMEELYSHLSTYNFPWGRCNS